MSKVNRVESQRLLGGMFILLVVPVVLSFSFASSLFWLQEEAQVMYMRRRLGYIWMAKT